MCYIDIAYNFDNIHCRKRFRKMKESKKKIIQTAIDLFNQHGVGNVRVHDIAAAAHISPGNLTYHFSTKKALMEAVYDYMKQCLEGMTLENSHLEVAFDALSITRDYLRFQIQFRFFYRDTLEIMKLFPDIRQAYKKRIQNVISFNRNVIDLAVEQGYMRTESHQGQYDILARNAWAVLNSWLIESEIMNTDVQEGIRASLELHYPHFTPKGQTFYYKMIDLLPGLVAAESDIKSSFEDDE